MYVMGVLLRNPRLAASAAPLASTTQLAIGCTEMRLSARVGYGIETLFLVDIDIEWAFVVIAFVIRVICVICASEPIKTN
jgi:hypothetical protein